MALAFERLLCRSLLRAVLPLMLISVGNASLSADLPRQRELAIAVEAPVALLMTRTPDAAQESRLLVLQRDGILSIVDRLNAEPKVDRLELAIANRSAHEFVAAAMLNDQVLVCVTVGVSDASSTDWQLHRFELPEIHGLASMPTTLSARQSLTPPGERELGDADSGVEASCFAVVKAPKQLFLAMSSQIWQARHLSDQLGTIRRGAGEAIRATALALTPEGYLLRASRLPDETVELTFRDPQSLSDQPPPPVPVTTAMTMQTGLNEVRSLRFSPEAAPFEQVLYALGRQGEIDGIYRIDATSDDGKRQLGCEAVLVEAIPNAIAMALDGNKVGYVLTHDEQTDRGTVFEVSLQ